jgi:polyhydroxybutyrate depolymerase
MESFSQFSALANREGFIAVYPDALALNWNDGRNASSIPSQAQQVDDVAFVAAMIREIEGRRSIDPKRIFAAGFSNGGIFVHYLANQLSARIAAIADVGGGIAEPLAPAFHPKSPMSVLMIHGTADPFVPFAGGDVDYGGFGRIISIPQTAAAWRKVNACDPKPESGTLPDTDASDQCLVKWSKWTGEKKQGELLLYTIEGGGHAWPGGPQFQPVSVIGRVCRDFDATKSIWEFFKEHPKT